MDLDYLIAQALGTLHNLIEDRAADAVAEIRLKVRSFNSNT